LAIAWDSGCFFQAPAYRGNLIHAPLSYFREVGFWIKAIITRPLFPNSKWIYFDFYFVFFLERSQNQYLNLLIYGIDLLILFGFAAVVIPGIFCFC